MIQKETNLKVADNSGAKSVRAFTLYGGQRNWTAARNYFWHKTCVCQKKAVILQAKF